MDDPVFETELRHKSCLAEIARLTAERDKLREALEKYADPNYNGYNGGPEHAIAALEQSTPKRKSRTDPEGGIPGRS